MNAITITHPIKGDIQFSNTANHKLTISAVNTRNNGAHA